MPVRYNPVIDANYKYRFAANNPWQNGAIRISNSEALIVSSENPNWRYSADGGGPFHVEKTYYTARPGYIKAPKYEGSWLGTNSSGFPATDGLYVASATLPASLLALGTEAIAKSIPTNPKAEVSVLIGELMREGIPHIIGSTAFKDSVHAAHKAGDEYLNVEFGWKPLVSAMKQFASAVLRAEEHMASYERTSARKVRRSFLFPAQEGTRSGGPFNRNIEGISDYWSHNSYTDTYKRQVWFRGAFRYYVPTREYNDFNYYKFAASKLLGLEITPEVAWNLAPWSWAADWFSNTGDIFHNISRLGSDGLVMQYGYIMAEHYASREILSEAYSPTLLAGTSSYYKRNRVVKQRLKATPYGFGLSYNGLSNTQKAIITALGLTRAF
jgi:hypothetical protein